jgi:hypothetical protein
VKIILKVTRENEDGSADAVVDYDDDGLQVIVQYGVVAMLKEGISVRKRDILDRKKKKVLPEMQSNLEDCIQAFYTVIDDIKLLYKTHGDRKLPMDENEMSNALLGLLTKSEMVAYWAENAFEKAFQLNDYASEESKARRAAIMGWNEEDDDGRC